MHLRRQRRTMVHVEQVAARDRAWSVQQYEPIVVHCRQDQQAVERHRLGHLLTDTSERSRQAVCVPAGTVEHETSAGVDEGASFAYAPSRGRRLTLLGA